MTRRPPVGGDEIEKDKKKKEWLARTNRAAAIGVARMASTRHISIDIYVYTCIKARRRAAFDRILLPS